MANPNPDLTPPPGAELHRWMTPRRLMLVSVVVAVLTIGLKTLAWWITGSVGLLSDAMESFVNLAAAMFGLWMVTVAERPADEDHPFGHHKAEYFSSGFEGILIIGAASAIIWAALPRFWAPQPLEQVGWGLALSVASSVLNGVLAWVMLRASRVHHSIALEADAKHLLTDVWTSAGVVGGLLLVGVTGWLWLDPLVAIGVALNIVREGGRLIRRSAHGLMDGAVEPEVQSEIDAVLARFARSEGGRDIVLFDHVMTRKAGARRFVNLHMHVPARWTLRQADDLRHQVEAALALGVPGLHASIQLLPDDVEPITADLDEPPPPPVTEVPA
ncbi:cation diffusion facilitator family transporter [Ottowia sp.]|uniref:cation diffusion facilitator family transporter n=1 Tax=Ottowia sp. TaxID=1898956 RepID=UPI002BE57E92|nr:cation diffusion facilitator family transporter [Ottowia sp.]HOB67632.1 cation diffusion facilitator family transporter [Ottowia sp.]HPZ57400.1 cation diffusion facilitator family transporter [Ottowia sp.]HQD47179.1 cation diffusion facilitator family transporter [Ottowia sp.]